MMPTRLVGVLAAAATVSASKSTATAPPISVSYTRVVDIHVSDLMPVFLTDELNAEWSPTLEMMRSVYDPVHGDLAHQQYKLPWPMASRDVLLKCERRRLDRDTVLTSECYSVESELVPPQKNVVRMELSRTAWRIESLPNERTRLSLSLEMPASVTAGVPKYAVQYCQRSSLRDSVDQLVGASQRLHLPPHENFVRWRRNRAEAAAALKRLPPVGAASASTLLAWVGEQAPTSALAAVVGALACALLVHALAFACLARVFRRTRSSVATEFSRRVSREELMPPQRSASPTTVLVGEGLEIAPPVKEMAVQWGAQRRVDRWRVVA